MNRQFEERAFVQFAQNHSNEDVSSALGFRNRGTLKCVLEKYDDAIADYNRSIELDPDISRTFICRAHAFLEIGKLSKAFDDAVHAYEIVKINDCPEDYMRLAMIFEECKKFDFVIDCINQYLRHVKELDFYHDDLGELWAVKKGYKTTSYCTTGIFAQIDWLGDAEVILNRIQKQFESDDKQQKLFPFSIIDELRRDLSITKEKMNDSLKKL